MKINKFLIVLIAVLSVVLAVLCAFALNGGINGGRDDENKSDLADESNGDTYQDYSNAENVSFPSEIKITRPVLSDIDDIKAEDFVQAPEGLEYHVEFSVAPDLNAFGEQNVVLRFVYKGNVFQRSTKLYLFHIESPCVFELASGGVMTVEDFVTDKSVEPSLVALNSSDIQLGTAGKRTVIIHAAKRQYEVEVIVKDTTAPTAKPREQSILTGNKLDASAFVSDISDQSPVVCSFETEPKWDSVGDQKVTVLLTDTSGNVGKCVSVVHIGDYVQTISFSGLDPIVICTGDTISYRSGVTCTDADGKSVTFTIDASGVDRNRQGTYQAIYTATDNNGASFRQTRTITVIVATEELVNSLCDEIIAQIIEDSFSTNEKIRAVWRWTKNNITYVGTSVSYEDELRVAYAAFVSHSGDCYTYYISNKYLLTRLGIPNVEVKRVPSVTRHWWNLVKFSDGKWYHVDSCPHPKKLEQYTYKMTESDLEWFEEQFKSSTHPNYYEYDHSLPQYSGLKIAQ